MGFTMIYSAADIYIGVQVQIPARSVQNHLGNIRTL